jgi:thiamine-phosphate pyrophosphorylase
MLPAPPLLLITDRSQARRPLVEIVAEAVAGGCRWVSLREKDLAPVDRLSLVRMLLPLLRAAGGRLTVHDDCDAAGSCDGLHLPSRANTAEVRRLLPPPTLLGQSCHSVAEVRAALAAGVDYVTLGPVFATASKPGYGPLAGGPSIAETLRGLPVLALGGVEPDSIAACRAAGFAGVAVMGSIMRAADPAATWRDLVRAWDAAQPEDAQPETGEPEIA